MIRPPSVATATSVKASGAGARSDHASAIVGAGVGSAGDPVGASDPAVETDGVGEGGGGAVRRVVGTVALGVSPLHATRASATRSSRPRRSGGARHRLAHRRVARRLSRRCRRGRDVITEAAEEGESIDDEQRRVGRSATHIPAVAGAAEDPDDLQVHPPVVGDDELAAAEDRPDRQLARRPGRASRPAGRARRRRTSAGRSAAEGARPAPELDRVEDRHQRDLVPSGPPDRHHPSCLATRYAAISVRRCDDDDEHADQDPTDVRPIRGRPPCRAVDRGTTPSGPPHVRAL